MNRREFTKTLGLGAVALGVGGIRVAAAKDSSQIAITMDDFSWANAVKLAA